MVDEIARKKGGRRPFADIEVATDFYRAEEYHQKYQEKAMAKRKVGNQQVG